MTGAALPTFDLTDAADIAALLNSITTAINAAVWKTGTGTISVPSGTGPSQDLAVSFGVTFNHAPVVMIWSTGTEGFILSARSATTTGFTANASSSGTTATTHNVPFAYAVVDSPWQNPYS